MIDHRMHELTSRSFYVSREIVFLSKCEQLSYSKSARRQIVFSHRFEMTKKCRYFPRSLPARRGRRVSETRRAAPPDTNTPRKRCRPATEGSAPRYASRSPAWSLSDCSGTG